MHILYILQYFSTPNGRSGLRPYEFAKRWAQKGHKVTLLTTGSGLVEKDLVGVGGKFVKRFSLEGFDVIAFNISYKQSMSFLRRIVAFIFFLVFASFAVLFVKKLNVVYATSTPLTVGVVALVAKWFRRKPFVFEVRDQWPAVPIEMGIIKNKILVKMLLRLEKRIYKSASAIVALSPGMAAGVKDVLGETKKPVVTIPNCSDTVLFRPDIDGTIIRKEYGWNDKLVLLHAGAMGKANGLDFVVNVADKLREHDDIHFVLIGAGSEKPHLAEKIKQSNLHNIEIFGPVSKAKLPQFFAACNVSMAIFANYPILEHNSANKFFDSLSAGKPILLNYSGWQRDVLEEDNAGHGCKLCDVDEFVEKVLYLASHRPQVKRMGRNARQIAEKKFNREKLAMQALEVATSCVGR